MRSIGAYEMRSIGAYEMRSIGAHEMRSIGLFPFPLGEGGPKGRVRRRYFLMNFHPSSRAQRSVVDGAMQTQDLKSRF